MNATITTPWKVGDRIRFTTTHSDGSTILYRVTVVRIDGDILVCRVPDRVLSLPFPPFTSKLIRVSASNPKAAQAREAA